MTLPQSYIATLVLMILGMICWGSWANTYKMAGSWRFELFYFDYAIGFMLAAAIAAFTLGTMGSDGFLVDIRFTYRATYYDQLMRAPTSSGATGGDNRLNSWSLGAHIGFEF